MTDYIKIKPTEELKGKKKFNWSGFQATNK